MLKEESRERTRMTSPHFVSLPITVLTIAACNETVDILKLYVNSQVEVAVAWLTHLTLLVIFRIMAWTLLFICAGW